MEEALFYRNNRHVSIDAEFLEREDISLQAKGMAAVISGIESDRLSEEIIMSSLKHEPVQSVKSAMNELVENGFMIRGKISCLHSGRPLGNILCFDTKILNIKEIELNMNDKYNKEIRINFVKNDFSTDEYVLEFISRRKGHQNVKGFINTYKSKILQNKCPELSEWHCDFINFIEKTTGLRDISMIQADKLKYIILNSVILERFFSYPGAEHFEFKLRVKSTLLLESMQKVKSLFKDVRKIVKEMR